MTTPLTDTFLKPKSKLIVAIMLVVSIAIAIMLATLVLRSRTEETLYSDDTVTVLKKTHFPYIGLDGGPRSTVIKVAGGRRFDNVAGAGILFLEIPAKDSILFLTWGNLIGEGPEVVHIVNTVTKKVTDIPVPITSAFGSAINTASAETMKVKRVDGDTVVIEWQEKGATSREFHFNLAQRVIEREF
jgi:hypothetical protein